MNNVSLAGKVQRINTKEKVAYITICAYTQKTYEYIDVTSFSPAFITDNIKEDDYIGIVGKLHANGAQHGYKLEVIAESISLLGKPPTTFSIVTDTGEEIF